MKIAEEKNLKKMPALEKRPARGLPSAKARKSVKKEVSVIEEQPEGTVQYYNRSGDMFYPYWFWLYSGEQEGIIETVTSADGKTVYLKNPVSQASFDTWVYGTVSDDGKSITVPLGQVLYYYDDYGYGYELAWGYLNDSGEELDYGTYSDVSNAIFTVGDDGTLTLENSYTDEEDNHIGLTLIWTDDKSLTGYMDYNTVYTPTVLPEIEKPSDDITTSSYVFKYNEYDSDDNPVAKGKLIEGAWDNDTLWIKGYEEDFPDAWIKGVHRGDSVTFAKGQLLAIYSNYPLYLYAADADNNLLDATFAYDEETETLTLPEGYALLTNASTEKVYYYGLYEDVQIKKYNEIATTPQTPGISSISDYYDYGYGYGLYPEVSLFDADGNFLDPEKLYYRVYADDDQLLTLYASDYYYFDEDMTEIPYTYSDDYDIGSDLSYLYIYQTKFYRVGLQLIYKGGGEEHSSAIGYLDFDGYVDETADITGTDIYQSFDGDEDQLDVVGSGKAESYDVAILVKDPNIVDAKVKGIRFPVNSEATSVTAYRGWLSTELKLDTAGGLKTQVADIAEATATIDGSWAEVTFTEPYAITDDGVFAGYSFTVTDTTGEGNQHPLMLAAYPRDNGYWLHTTNTYLNWTEHTSAYDASVPIVLLYEDGTRQAYSARPINIGSYFVGSGKDTTLTVTVANDGTADLSAIDYTVSVDGEETTGHYDFASAISGTYYGQQADADILVPAQSVTGAHTLTVTIDKINDNANGAALADDAGQLNILSFVPVHKPLVEEYTGTWCGWCPRGLVGMKMLAAAHGDNFVGIAYHEGDPMQAAMTYDGYYEYFPNDISGYPRAVIDRGDELDPYYGSGDDVFGIDNDWEKSAAQFGYADIDVSAKWSDDLSTIDVTATTTFAAVDNDATYDLEFALVEDDMSGTDDDWEQSNYYASYASYYGDEPNLGVLTTLDSYIVGYHFNDVFLISSGFGAGTESLPESVEINKDYTSSYTFTVSDILNKEGEAMIQDGSKLRAVAILINTATGKAVNCNQGDVATNTKIRSAEDDDAAAVAYSDLSGRRLTNTPRKGLYIETVTTKDGKVKNYKKVSR